MRPLLVPRSGAARPVGVVLAAAGLAVMAALPARSASGAVAAAWRASEVLSPAGGSYGVLYGMTCSARAACIAGGSFYAASRSELPMIAVESAGKWGRGRALRLPPGANALDQDALAASVACPGARGPDRCVAAGYYDDRAGMQGFIAEGSGARWGRAARVLLPPGAGAAGTGALSGIRCTGAGACIAVGGYETAAGADAALIVTQSRGRWRRAARVLPPGNAAKKNSGAHLSAVSCQAKGECVAVGAYFTRSGASEGMAVAEAKGRWRKAVQTPLPANAPKVPQAELYSAGCTPHRYCVAVGTYFTARGNQAVMAVMYEGGRWRRPVDITALPANASTPNPGASLNAVSCAALTCLAAGNYKDKQGGQVGMSVSESGGRWQRAVQVSLPAHAARQPAQQAYLFAVTCAPGWCAAGGQYTDSAGIPQAMAAHRPGVR